KPHRKKKPFINKKNAVTFHLVHRSQKDPLAADEKAPQHVLLPASKVEVEKRREEQRQFGVFFDDDYNYLQHLKEASRPAELISASQTQRNAQTVTFRDEEEEENEEEEEEKGKEEVMVIPGDISQRFFPHSLFYQGKYADYSMIILTSEQEKTELDILLYVSCCLLLMLCRCQTPEQLGPPELPTVKEEDDEEEEMETLVIEEPPTEKWDCETIISTYSNIYNHPKLIEDPKKQKQIRVSSKTGIPLDVLPKKGLTARQVERMERINDSDLPRVSTQPRSREESKEDRKLRKQAIKDERKERRVEKKANKVAFKQEKLMQEKQMVGLRANVQGMKLS
uniref:Protein LTV1 homolog n=1 Tax=Astyanax mexicanus TaxID=7994 RepID=A0A8B9RAT1_ASTMX